MNHSACPGSAMMQRIDGGPSGLFIFLMKPEHHQPVGAAGVQVEGSIRAGSQAGPPGPSESLRGHPCSPFLDGCLKTCFTCLHQHEKRFSAHITHGPGTVLEISLNSDIGPMN